MTADGIKIEGSGSTVDKGNAIEQEGSGEEGEQDELGCGFCAFVAVLVERHDGRHGHGGEFETDEEHQEVTARNHKVHPQKGEEGDEVELPLLDEVFFARKPFVSHQKGHDGAHVEHGLDDNSHLCGHVHSAECLTESHTTSAGDGTSGEKVEERVNSK